VNYPRRSRSLEHTENTIFTGLRKGKCTFYTPARIRWDILRHGYERSTQNDCIIRKTTYFVPFCGRLIGIAYCIGNNMQYTKTTTTTTTATTTRNYTHVLCVLRRPAHTASYYCSRTRRDTNFVMASSNCDVRRQTNKRPDSADAFIVICRCLYAYDTAPQAY
jgi:hypothetical protein